MLSYSSDSESDLVCSLQLWKCLLKPSSSTFHYFEAASFELIFCFREHSGDRSCHSLNKFLPLFRIASVALAVRHTYGTRKQRKSHPVNTSWSYQMGFLSSVGEFSLSGMMSHIKGFCVVLKLPRSFKCSFCYITFWCSPRDSFFPSHPYI